MLELLSESQFHGRMRIREDQPLPVYGYVTLNPSTATVAIPAWQRTVEVDSANPLFDPTVRSKKVKGRYVYINSDKPQDLTGMLGFPSMCFMHEDGHRATKEEVFEFVKTHGRKTYELRYTVTVTHTVIVEDDSLERAKATGDTFVKEDYKGAPAKLVTSSEYAPCPPKFGAASFDGFAANCPFFTSQVEGNNGYGCMHPDQEMGDDENKEFYCYCSSCPLGMEADEESVGATNVDWDDLTPDPKCMEGEYILIPLGPDATETQKRAWEAYQRYLQRYDKE